MYLILLQEMVKMSEFHAKRLKADVRINTELPVDTVVKSISEALSVDLKLNSTGKFEEFIGYEGAALGLSVTLLFDPGDPEGGFDFEIYGSHGDQGEAIDIASFIISILHEKTGLSCDIMT